MGRKDRGIDGTFANFHSSKNWGTSRWSPYFQARLRQSPFRVRRPLSLFSYLANRGMLSRLCRVKKEILIMSSTYTLSRRHCIGSLAGFIGYGYSASALSKLSDVFLLRTDLAAIPVHSAIVNFQYEIKACCAYYEGTGTYTQFPVKLDPNQNCMQLFVSGPGQAEKPLDGIPGSEFLPPAHNAHWGGVYTRSSNPLPQDAKGAWNMRLQALTFRSMARFGNCKCSGTEPSLQIDASYTVLINGEATPSLPSPYGSFRWDGKDNKPENQQTIWTFIVS
jgi:hypothetical protein